MDGAPERPGRAGVFREIVGQAPVPALPAETDRCLGRAQPGNDGGNIGDMKKSLLLSALALMLMAALAVVGCGQQAPKQTDGDNGTPAVGASEVEAVARAFIEIAGSFDYRDQKSQYDQLQPLLADKYPFQEDLYAVSTQRIQTTHATATRVVSISKDDAIVTVTYETFRRNLPDQSSRMVEEHLLQQSDCRLVLQEGRWLVSRSRPLSGEPLPQEGGETPSNGPTPSTKVSPVPTAHQEEIKEAIEELARYAIGPNPKFDLEVGGNTYYVDSSGTEWVGFTVFPVPASATDPAFGVAKRASGQSWELAFWGTGPIHDIPDDVAKGLGIDWRR